MIDLAATIEAMKSSGMTADEIVRALACVHVAAPAQPTRTARQERNHRYYVNASEKRLKASEQDVSDGAGPSPKEAPQTPQETPPSTPSTQKENPLRGQKKGSRLPADFVPSLEVAAELGLSPAEAKHQAAVFIDFWNAKAGADAVKLDWPATWRNWVRRSAREAPRPNARGSPQRPPSQADVFKFIGESAANGRQDDKDRDGVRQAVSYLPAVGSG